MNILFLFGLALIVDSALAAVRRQKRVEVKTTM